MGNWIDTWKDSMLDDIVSNFGASSRLNDIHKYNNQNIQWEHYTQSEHSLDLSFNADPYFRKAIFLHGLTKKQIQLLVEKGIVEKEVVGILVEMWKIDSLNSSGEFILNGLVRNILPSIKDIRGVFVHLIETLNHIDKERKLEKWTGEFSTNPLDLPEDLHRLYYHSVHITYDNIVSECELSSKIADYYGLYLIKDVFCNKSLLYRNEKVFRRIVKLVCEANESIESRASIETVLHYMSTYTARKNIHWEWDSVARIYNKLYEGKNKNIDCFNIESVFRSGKVVIICDSIIECYETLGLLHSKYKYIPGKLVDFIGRRVDGGKLNGNNKVIKTKIIGFDGQFSGDLEVLIVAGQKSNKKRYEKYPYHYKAVENDAISVIDNSEIVIFTPSGMPYKINKNCTIKEFVKSEDFSSRMNKNRNIMIARFCSDVLSGEVQTRSVEMSVVSDEFILLNDDVVHLEERNTDDDNVITVFTPEGEAFKCVYGDTVLNFAYRLHSEILVRIPDKNSVIIVNEQIVDDIFYILRNHDVVKIKVGKELTLLPLGWQNKVPAHTIVPIKKKFRKYYRQGFVALGRKYLEELLLLSSLQVTDNEKALDSIMMSVIESMDSYHRGYKKYFLKSTTDSDVCNISELDWWYQELGKFHSMQLSFQLVDSPIFSDSVIEQIKIVIKKVISQINVILEEKKLEFDVAKVRKHITCNKCKPDFYDDLIAEHLNDKNGQLVIIFHKEGSSCQGANAIPVSLKIYPNKPGYFTIKIQKTDGIISDVVDVFNRYGLNIHEMIQQSILYTSIVLRILVNVKSKSIIENVLGDINLLPGEKELFGPSDLIPLSLESGMTPRKLTNIRKGSSITPFVVGPKIKKDNEFYGMKNELDLLKSIFNSIDDNHSEGEIAIIKGPKRIGKSSLALSLIRYLKNRKVDPSRSGSFLWYYELKYVPQGSRQASVYFGKLFHSLQREMVRFSKKNQIPEIRKEINAIGTKKVSYCNKIIKLLQLINNVLVDVYKFKCLLVIDEFQFLGLSPKKDNEYSMLLKFLEELRDTQNCMTILISPKAAFEHKIKSELNKVTKNYHPVDIDGIDIGSSEDLLCARKKDTNYVFEIKRNVMDIIFKDTRGNPCFLNIIGNKLWKNALRRHIKIDNIIITKDIYDRVFEEISCEDNAAFRAYDLLDSGDINYKTAIVWALCRHKNGQGSMKQIKNTIQRAIKSHKKYTWIQTTVKHTHYNLDSSIISNELLFLIDSGFIVEIRNEKTSKYSLYPRLIHEHYFKRFY
jgi:(p)ppGpp synthase/HD superfamily hydrolase